LAAAHFEKIERAAGESFGGAPRRKRAIVGARGGCAGVIGSDAASDVAARISVAEAHLQDGGRAQTQHVLVTPWEKLFGMEVVRENLFEARSGQPIADATRDFAEIQAFAWRIGRAEQTLQSAAQVLRADKQRLGGIIPQLDQANGWSRW